MKNPYVIDNIIRIRVVLPCNRKEAWEFIGTAEGYARWFPETCSGSMVKGEKITCTWWGGEEGTDRYEILDAEEGVFVEHNWETAPGGRVRYEIESDDPAVVRVEATYPRTTEGKSGQLIDVAPWAFAILNLKSVASGGVDLRCRDENRPHSRSYLD